MFNVAPTDGGSRLDAAVQIDFAPVLGLRLDDSAPLAETAFVRDLDPRFDFFLSGNAEGSITFGPAEASIAGNVSIGDDDLEVGGFTAAVTTHRRRLDDPAVGTGSTAYIDLDLGGNVPVNASLDLHVPTPFSAIKGSMDVSADVPGT